MLVLGRYDRIDLPELGLSNIHAKVDTGAYSCSLHCQYAKVVNGTLEFVLLDEEHPEFTGMKFVFKEFQEKIVKNSFGEKEKRFVIHTTIRLYDDTIETTFSLSNRGSLKFPVLIGRKLIRGRYMIDVTKINQSYRDKRSRQKKEAKRSKTERH